MKKCPRCGEDCLTVNEFLTMGLFSKRHCKNCNAKVEYGSKARLNIGIAIIAMLVIILLGIDYFSSVLNQVSALAEFGIIFVGFLLVNIFGYGITPLSEVKTKK